MEIGFQVLFCGGTALLRIFSFEEARSLAASVSKGHKCNPQQKQTKYLEFFKNTFLFLLFL